MSVVDLILPKLGESIMEATILKWHKAVGDTIQLDETLLDIATDKVDSEIPSTTAGTITEILFEVNAVVPIGTVIARIQTSGSNDSTPKTEKVQVTEIIKETPIRQRLSGIATGSSTVITFPDGSGNYFSVGDYVTIEGASPTGINTVHMPVTAVTSTTATVAYASQSVTGVSVTGSTSLVKSLKVSAIGAGAGCDVSIAEVQIVSQA